MEFGELPIIITDVQRTDDLLQTEKYLTGVFCNNVCGFCTGSSWRIQLIMATKNGVVYLALCGFGRAGNMHLTSIRHNFRCKLKYVVDIPDAVESVQNRLGSLNMNDVLVVSSEQFESVVLKDDQVAGVLVTTPTNTHEEYICKSIEAGKAVFSEKPIAENIESIIKCYAEAEKIGVPLLCAFNRRFDGGFSGVKQMVDDNKLGKLYSLRSTSRDSPLPPLSYIKISYGMYHDCAVHDIDAICWIIGEEPLNVYAHGYAHHPDISSINDYDTIAIVLTFPSGVIATIDLCRHSSYGYDQRLEVKL